MHRRQIVAELEAALGRLCAQIPVTDPVLVWDVGAEILGMCPNCGAYGGEVHLDEQVGDAPCPPGVFPGRLADEPELALVIGGRIAHVVEVGVSVAAASQAIACVASFCDEGDPHGCVACGVAPAQRPSRCCRTCGQRLCERCRGGTHDCARRRAEAEGCPPRHDRMDRRRPPAPRRTT